MKALRSHNVSTDIETSRPAQIPYPPTEPPVLVLWLNQVTRRFFGEPPQTPRADSVVSHYPTPAPVHNFILLFCHHVARTRPLATGSLKPSLLVSPLLRGPARHRPFVLALHLHQCKSSRNRHLQYSAKSQSTPSCESLITTRSNHP
jgi:hypothetical protein